jgi:DNA-binding NtrC family response regulator
MDEEIRVLYVDDDATALRTRGQLLEEHERIEVITRADVDSGLEALSTTRVDCILSDYRMPERDGLEFLAAVRDEHPELPFIFFSGHDSEALVTEALSAGATDYLPKSLCSLSYELVANRIISAVEHYHIRQP